MAACVALHACGSDAPSAPPTVGDLDAVFHGVTLTDHAIMLGPDAPYDTLTIGVMAYNGNGVPLADVPTPVFESTDPVSVSVSPDGVITGHIAGKSASVIASLTIGGVTLADTAMVQVALAAPSLSSFSVAILAPDSAKMAAGRTKTITTHATGTNLMNTRVYYQSSDPKIITFKQNRSYSTAYSTVNRLATSPYAVAPGNVRLYASATVGGVRYRDSVDIIIGYPISATVLVTPMRDRNGDPVYVANPSNITLGLGGTISWYVSTPSYGIVFSDTTFPKATGKGDNADGNIAPWVSDGGIFSPNAQQSRRFLRPGHLTFYSPENGISGEITIVDDRACQPDCPPFPE
jgi:hypothetical protein